ncbi:MAG: polyprenol monophosphomannose synthase [bacterium]
MKKTIAVIPTYNERENIAALIHEIRQLENNIEVLVVDDNSPDGTGKIVEELMSQDSGVHIFTRDERRGRGFAGADGFQWTLDYNYDVIIEMDADGSHPPEDIPRLIAELNNADVVIASRLIPGGGEKGRGLSRRIVTILANWYIRTVLGVKVRDCTSGFRCFRREVLETINPKKLLSPGPTIVEEVLYLCHLHRFRIHEIPFVFHERKSGISKLNIKILFRSLMDVWKIKNSYKNECK